MEAAQMSSAVRVHCVICCRRALRNNRNTFKFKFPLATVLIHINQIRIVSKKRVKYYESNIWLVVLRFWSKPKFIHIYYFFSIFITLSNTLLTIVIVYSDHYC
jgi:hypothetical protein